jgi:hypothetical protein
MTGTGSRFRGPTGFAELALLTAATLAQIRVGLCQQPISNSPSPLIGIEEQAGHGPLLNAAIVLTGTGPARY